MKHTWFVPAISLVAACQLDAQPRQNWFPLSDMTTVGVYYYPEAWPESQWARDMANIKKLGMEFVHMGEFAWTFMEPQEGKHDFRWLDANVDLAARQGLKVVLCTPTPTPPVWLVRKHPEVLMIDSRGRRMNHGSREHACWSVPKYREYTEKIVSQIGLRYGSNPAVWGWQIDNELSHYSKNYCYCNFCRDKFRAWLRKKYENVDNLNRDWGNSFWSQMYSSFSEIDLPNEEELPQQANPHAKLDFQRWFAEEAADFLRFQAEILRRYTKTQWVTTNYMTMHRQLNPALSAKDLDVITWTHYPVHGNLNTGPLGFRMGDAAIMSFMHDFTRPLTGLFGLMELQPGQVNWGEVNPWPYPGAIRMWIHRAFAAGAQIVCTYRYRQPLSGGELYHSGLVLTDGVTPSPGGREYSQAMSEIRKLRESFRPGARPPQAYAARKAGFLYSYDAFWDIGNHTQTTRWDTQAHVLRHYNALKTLGAPVDVITEEREFSSYPFLIAPAYQLVDKELIERFRKYSEQGGHLILTTRTGHKDRRGHLWEAMWAEPIYDLIGARIPIYDLLPAPHTGTVRMGQVSWSWGSWADILEPGQGTTTLATYTDQFYAGKAAATTRKLGKGSVTYIGPDTLGGEFEKEVYRRVYAAAGVATERFPNQFIVDWRDGFWIATNFTEKPVPIPGSPKARILIGDREVAPAGVTVWMEQ
jgi:beta-galactosidase